jgi:maltooligosyltrehalose trehalohydrolase
MQKLLAGTVLFSPYLPLLFMGEEWSEPNPFLYFISHTDLQLVEAVRKGRMQEFAAFYAQGEAPDPFADETFQQSKLQWHLLEQEPHKTMHRFYKTLIALRKQQPVLRSLNRNQLSVETKENENVLMLHHWQDEQQLLIFENFSASPQVVNIPAIAPHWKKLLDSAAPEWNGPVATPNVVSQNDGLTLQPESILVYVNHQ